MFQSVVQASFCVVAGALLQATSCLVTSLPEDSDGSSVARDYVRVRFINQTDRVLDVQFYATAEAGEAETVLFLDGNRITADIGLAGSGLIAAAQTDEIELLCLNARTIGTRGGEFLDPESGALAGTGQQRVLVLDQQYNCEETITLIYKASGSNFDTSYLVD